MSQTKPKYEAQFLGAGNEAEVFNIINECLNGNPDRFEVLVTQYKKLVFSIVYRHFNGVDEVEDIAQEVFIRAYKSLYTYNPKYKFASWLAKITENLCLDILRKRKLIYTALDEVDLYVSDYRTPEVEYIQKEERSVLYDAINRLPEKYRSIFYLYHEDGISYKEIAAMLELPLSCIKNRLFRARLMLKENIASMNGNLYAAN